jgi:hypothetical protein
VKQAVLARHDLHDRAEVQQLEHGAVVGLAHFDRFGQLFDAPLGFLAGGGVDGSDGHDAFVGDVDLGAGFFGQRAERCIIIILIPGEIVTLPAMDLHHSD